MVPMTAQGAPLLPEINVPAAQPQKLEGELTINLRGAEVSGTQMKTNTGPGFVVQVRTGTQ